jgi:uncharacterized integral membrane protein
MEPNMKSAFRILVFVPLALIILFFAMANRSPVHVSLDPFVTDASGPAFDAPLYIVELIALALGVIAGGFATWISHLPVRRAARVAHSEAKKTRAEIEKLRQQALANLPQDKDGKN